MALQEAIAAVTALPWRKRSIATVEEILAVLDIMARMNPPRPTRQDYVIAAKQYVMEELGIEGEEAERYANVLAALAEAMEAATPTAERRYDRVY